RYLLPEISRCVECKWRTSGPVQCCRSNIITKSRNIALVRHLHSTQRDISGKRLRRQEISTARTRPLHKLHNLNRHPNPTSSLVRNITCKQRHPYTVYPVAILRRPFSTCRKL